MDFSFNSAGDKIKFSDTEGISHETWKKFFIRLNYIGYAFHDADDVKKYFDRKVFLNTDQTAEVLRILQKGHDSSLYTASTIKEYNTKAKNHFGTTYSFALAGYILTDGSLLSLSYTGHHRDIDHRDIEEVLKTDSDEHSAAMIKFINFGNIRVTSNGLNLSVRPNELQKKSIIRFVQYIRRKQDDLYIDISNTAGMTAKAFHYENPDSQEVISDIDKYFDMIEI